jgi:sugar/nucleoside kinase (ribokinase family)
MSILVVGSVAIDSVKTPFGTKEESLGGSATYFSVAASFFNKVDIIAVAGTDFPKKYITLLKKRGIGTEGLKIVEGKTFHWKGRYDSDLNTAHTLDTQLNVFRDFKPEIPEDLRSSDVLFLANIDPDLQYDVLRQMKRRPRLVACDSMNFWIEQKRGSLRRLWPLVDILFLNEAEARQFTGEAQLASAARKLISLGPKAVIIKKGEHGVVYFSKKHYFLAPAYLLNSLRDPTGAGDTFGGGMIGYLSTRKTITEEAIRQAVIYGSIVASFTVQDFSINKLLKISFRDIKNRYAHFRSITRF